jgi:hypothetical protein
VFDYNCCASVMRKRLCCAALFALIPLGALAGDVAVLNARLQHNGGGSWRAEVTLEHADSGWDHYADAWRVVSKDGVVYGVRTLLHPHESEQPFTRSQSGIMIPKAETTVFIEAHDKVHGWARQRLQVDLSKALDGKLQVSR